MIELPNGAKITVLGADITNNLEEGFAYKVSVAKKGAITIYKAYMGTNDYVSVGSATALTGSNAYLEFSFENGVVFDTLSMSYDGRNTFTDTFEGAEDDIFDGIYNNYYTVSGYAMVVPYAKDKVVTFVDSTTGNELFKTYTYAGGKVKLLSSVEGSTGAVVWDKSQADLDNVQDDITVSASLGWKDCSVSFEITKLFNFIQVDGNIASINGKYGEEITLPTLTYGDTYQIVGWTDVKGSAFAKYSDTYVLKDASKKLYSVWGGRLLTVNFYDDDDNLLETQKVEYQGTALFKGEVPEKEGYKFIGWDSSTVGLTEDTDFYAQYERVLAKVQVSVLGGTGAGRYTEGDVVTIAFRDIAGLEFVDWKVISGDVTIKEKNGKYTFVVGTEDVVIQAIQEGEESGAVKPPESIEEEGCGSTISLGMVSLALILSGACFALRRKDEE